MYKKCDYYQKNRLRQLSRYIQGGQNIGFAIVLTKSEGQGQSGRSMEAQVCHYLLIHLRLRGEVAGPEVRGAANDRPLQAQANGQETRKFHNRC